jgi:hypothetical protein
MKLINHCLLFVALSLAVTVQAQTAEEIIAKHIEAIGGKQKLSSINSVVIDNTIEAGEITAPAKIFILNGKGYRNDADFNGQKVVSVYTDKKGWAINPFVGVSDPQPMLDEQYKSGEYQIFIIPLLHYATRGEKAELVGQEKIGNVNAYKIKLTNKNNNAVYYLIDPTTYYIIQTINTVDFAGQATTLTSSLSDYKKTDYGWVVPHTVGIDFGGQFYMVSKTNKVDLNTTVDPTIFEMKK